MVNESKQEKVKKLTSEYHKKLKQLEVGLAEKHRELNHIEQKLQHESKKIYGSTSPTISTLKSDKLKINMAIMKLKKEVKRIRADYAKKLKRL
jgi:hypothetical protein